MSIMSLDRAIAQSCGHRAGHQVANLFISEPDAIRQVRARASLFCGRRHNEIVGHVSYISAAWPSTTSLMPSAIGSILLCASIGDGEAVPVTHNVRDYLLAGPSNVSSSHSGGRGSPE